MAARASNPGRRALPPLVLIAALYSILAILYAVNVPRWNAPDEPAHFNYVRFLAERGQFPVLEPGSYDGEYLERLKAARFPPHLSIDGLTYEAHQPPLYYLLGAIVFKSASAFGLDAQVLALRLLSGLSGLLLLVVGYATARRIFPDQREVASAVAAILAFIPMHTAVNAAIGNDPLANLILAVIVWESAGIVIAGHRLPRLGGRLGGWSAWPQATTLRLGLWLGLALLTKTTAYVGVIVAVGAVLLAARRQAKIRAGLRQVAVISGVAILVSGWWFWRNGTVYGWADPMALRRHDTIMAAAGQPQTNAFSIGLVQEMVWTSFQSFWGQFGWMGVLLDQRVYMVLAALCLAATIGLATCALALRHNKTIEQGQRDALTLLLLAMLLVGAAMAQYNFSSFFQPQGRYLFPALVPFAIGLALGIRTLVVQRHAGLVLGSLAAGLAALDFLALYRYVIPGLAGH